MKQTVRPILLAGALAAAAPGPVLAADGDVLEGEVIARQWCAECHVVADDQVSASVDVPTFHQIAQSNRLDARSLSAFLADPHPLMPDMSLSRQEIADLVAYIDTFRDPEAGAAD